MDYNLRVSVVNIRINESFVNRLCEALDGPRERAGDVVGKITERIVVMVFGVSIYERRLFGHRARLGHYPACEIAAFDNALGLARFESAAGF